MGKRIFQYPEVTELAEDDYIMIDSETDDTRCILASKIAPSLMSKTVTERKVYTASEDGVKGYSSVDVKVPFTNITDLEGDIVSFDDGEDLPLASLKTTIVPVQSGSGDPSPSNVRPISGWSGANVSVCGTNVWDEEWEVGDIDAQGNPTSSTTLIRAKNFNPCKPNTTYKVVIPSGASMYMKYYDKDKNFISPTVSAGSTITPPSNCYYFKFVMGSAYGTTYNNDISINYPSTDTSYHAYNGHTYSIPFQDFQGNPIEVFGGELDVVNGGENPSPYVKFEISENWGWNASSSYPGAFYISDAYLPYSIKANTEVKCSHAKNVNNLSDYVNGTILHNTAINIRIMPENSTVQDFKDYIVAQRNANKPIEIWAELATPSTFNSQPTSIKSLEGENNVWGDCGKSLVSYQKTWIQPDFTPDNN